MKKYLGLLSLFAAASLHATPTGLNNIPTADTVPHRTVAIQAFSSFGGANQFATGGPGQHSFWMGFKTGWELGPATLEWGLDSPLGSEFTGPLLFQTKVGFKPWEGGALALGIAGVALTDIDRSGDPFTYAMVAHDFGFARAHLGYGVQTNGNSLLVGLDRTWKLLDRDFNLNADLVQVRDQDAWLPSIGAKYALSEHIVLETWANIPDQGTMSFIAKINFVFKF